MHCHINKRIIGNILLYCVFTIFMILAIHSKKNMHVDEVYSYGLSNSAMCMTIEDGVTYYPASSPWLDYMTVDDENRFNYTKVWENQASDVHPPLYYALLHTICSFFPNSFSIWFAGLINIVFALATLFFAQRIVRLLTDNSLVNRLFPVLFICSAGILSAVTYFRMYIVAMFWVTAFTYLVVKQIEEKNTVRTYLLFLCVTVGGALTHYYCIVYIVLSSIVYGCYLLCKKNWKGIGCFCLTQGISALISIAVFPAMLKHIFVDGRGTESVDNLANTVSSIAFKRLQIFFNMIDEKLFGGIFVYVFFILLLCLCIMKKDTYKRLISERKVLITRYLCIIIPVTVYFILISRIAAYVIERYMLPIYAVLYVVVLCGIGECLHIFGGKKYVPLLSIVAVVMSVNSWKNMDWIYLFKESEGFIENASNYSDVDCLYIYDAEWRLNPSYYEVSNYHSVTFLKKDELDLLSDWDVDQKYHLIVTIINETETEEILNNVMDYFPVLDTYDYLGGYGYSNTYYMHGQ